MSGYREEKDGGANKLWALLVTVAIVLIVIAFLWNNGTFAVLFAGK